MHQQHADAIVNAADHKLGMDILIISTATGRQAEFWEKRLPSILKKGSLVIGVPEDWPRGAGNGLGTLYAIKQAREKLIKRNGSDLLKLLKEGKSIAVYHTAGEGKRLSPLALSEYNNKSAVKLPGRRSLNGPDDFLTILEAVAKQSSLFSQSMQGRITVFWGDQIFLPSKKIENIPRSAVLLFTKLQPKIELPEWQKMKLDNYGIVVFDKLGNPSLIEKTTFDHLQKLDSMQRIQLKNGLGVSMGCFSLSYEMTLALLQEFEPELCAKNIKMDSDTHFWMALTIDEESYLSIMDNAKQHYQRMRRFKERFCSKHHEAPLFNIMDIGKEAYWWDFGNILNYYQNNMKIVQENPEGQAMRTLYLIDPSMFTDEGSCLVHCSIRHFTGKKSVLAGVAAEKMDVRHCLILNVCANQIEGAEGLIYNVEENEPLKVHPKEVRSDLFLSDAASPIKMRTSLDRNGKDDWSIHLKANSYSYEEISSLCKKETKQECPAFYES